MLLIICNLQPDSDIGKAGIATHTYFLSRLTALLPFVNVETITAVTEPLPQPAKRRKPNLKTSREQTLTTSDAAVKKDMDSVSGEDTSNNN